MGDTSQKQESGQSYKDFLLYIAGQVDSEIKKNRPRFEQQVKKFETHPDLLDTLIERDKFSAMFNSLDSQRNIDYNKNGGKVSALPGEEICTKEEDELRQYYLLSVIHAFMTDYPAVVDRSSESAMSVWDRFTYRGFTTIHRDRSGEKAFIERALKSVQDDIEAINSNKIQSAGVVGAGEKKKKGFWSKTLAILGAMVLVLSGIWYVFDIGEKKAFQEFIKWIGEKQTQKQVDNQSVSGQIPAKTSNDPNQKKP